MGVKRGCTGEEGASRGEPEVVGGGFEGAGAGGGGHG